MAAKKNNTTPPEILTREQKDFLDLAAIQRYLCERFYLTGGTPLAAFYLQHRLSEDIDLFSEKEIYLPAIRLFIKKAQDALSLEHIEYSGFLGLHSFQLYFPGNVILKVDFNYYPFPRIERGIRYATNLEVDSIFDIAVNKVHTIAMKPRARDFIDIYFILQQQKYKLSDLWIQAKAKFDWHIDPIHLGARLSRASEMTDYPRMLKPIDHNEWKAFFVEEARKLKNDIFG